MPGAGPGEQRQQDVPLPALLRGALRTYGEAVRRAVADAGFDDLPKNGPYVIGAIAHAQLPLSRIIVQLGLSKQAAGQLVDTLVLRGYLDREADTADRRRLTISLTSRGAQAAAVARGAIERVDADVAARTGAKDVEVMRRTLAAVTETGAPGEIS
jgi:DNA-binding MarR family transcriptional regulator